MQACEGYVKVPVPCPHAAHDTSASEHQIACACTLPSTDRLRSLRSGQMGQSLHQHDHNTLAHHGHIAVLMQIKHGESFPSKLHAKLD